MSMGFNISPGKIDRSHECPDEVKKPLFNLYDAFNDYLYYERKVGHAEQLVMTLREPYKRRFFETKSAFFERERERKNALAQAQTVLKNVEQAEKDFAERLRLARADLSEQILALKSSLDESRNLHLGEVRQKNELQAQLDNLSGVGSTDSSV